MPKLGPATSTSPGCTPAAKSGPHRFQAVPGDHLDAVLHGVAGRELIGVDVGADAPDPGAGGAVVLMAGPHASTSRGSVITPRSAEAATV